MREVALAFVIAVLAYGCGMTTAELLPLAHAHLLFLCSAAVLYSVGRAVNAAAPSAERGWFWRLFRRTLPWHPVFAGFAIGALLHEHLPDGIGDGRLASGIYFGASGVVATYAHDILRTWSKYGPKE